MMIPTVVPIEDSKQSLPESEVRLTPPPGNPFIAGPSISLTKSRGKVTFRVGEVTTEQVTTDIAEQFLESLVARVRRAVERYPKSANAHANLGVALLNQGRVADAIAEFESALRLNPNHYVSSLNLARLKVAQGQLEEAIALYESLRRSDPTDSTPRISLASLMIRRGDLDEAERILSEVISINEVSALGHYHLATVLLRKGKTREAISHLKIAARSDIRSAAVHHALGVAYEIEGDYRRAAHAFRAALRLAPDHKQATSGLARTFLARGEPEKAILFLSEYLGRSAENPDLREMLAQALREVRRLPEARTQLLRALRSAVSTSERARLMNNIGVCLASEGQLKEAEEWYWKSIKLGPQVSALPYENLSRVLLEAGRVREAMDILRMAGSYFPNSLGIRALQAVCLEKEGCYDEAVEELQSVVNVENAPAEYHAALGGLLVDTKRDPESAIRVLERGRQLFPRHPVIINNLAYSLLTVGQVDAAETVLGWLPPKHRDDVYLTATRGLLLLWKGDFEKARQKYLEAKKLATAGGNAELARTVEQKMYLELARGYLRVGNRPAALQHVERGLKVKGGKITYREDLEKLLGNIQ